MHNVTTEGAVAFVTLMGPGSTKQFELPEGVAALVGSGSGCHIQIPDATVAERQCLIEFRNEQLLVHNWNPDSPTRVNGATFDEATEVTSRDVLSFGNYQMNFGRPALSPVAAAAESKAPLPSLKQESAVPSSTDETTATLSSANADSTDVNETVELTDTETAPLSVDDRFADFDETPSAAATPAGKPATAVDETSVEDSTISLLHSEIEFLQKELEEREATISEMRSHSASRSLEEVAVSASSNRMEDLLFELQMSDERLSNLEHELRILEELQAAEADEKRQIEAWVGDIEARIARREEESEAEIGVLRSRLERESQERVATQNRADATLTAGGDMQLAEELNRLRQEHEATKQKLDESTDRCRQLEQQVAEHTQSGDEAAIEARIEQALRQERLTIAQERAAISRREHDITARLKEMETHMEMEASHPKTNEIDEKFHVFREHLKELHQQDMADYRPPSMGQRLMKLWHSLDGPTDRD